MRLIQGMEKEAADRGLIVQGRAPVSALFCGIRTVRVGRRGPGSEGARERWAKKGRQDESVEEMEQPLSAYL